MTYFYLICLIYIILFFYPNSSSSWDLKQRFPSRWKSLFSALTISSSLTAFPLVPTSVAASEIAYSNEVKRVPLYTERNANVQLYNDISHGFKLLRPFGFNEFQGAGTGYLVKFSSLFDIDENVVVGYSDAAADKKSIVDYGSIEKIGEKLALKRGGKVVDAQVRETDGTTFYQFQFEYPLDSSLPRPRNMKASKGIELFELCVSRGKIWSVQATSNEKLFPSHEKTLRIALESFLPRL